MKKYLKSLSLAACFVFALGLEAGDWRFSIGGSYKQIDDIDIDVFRFVNDSLPAGSTHTTGNQSAVSVEIVDVVQRYGNNVALHNIDFGGFSGDADEDGYGLILGMQRVGECFNVDFGIGCASFNDSRSLAGVATKECFSTPATGAWVGNVWTANMPPAPADFSAQVAPGGIDATGTVGFDYDLDLYTISMGLSKNFYLTETLAINVGGGPELTIGDYDMARTQTVRFTDPGTTLAYSKTEKDDGTDVLFGGYVSAGVLLGVTERLSVQADVKYEFVAGDLETDFADLGLSGFGGDVRLILSF